MYFHRDELEFGKGIYQMNANKPNKKINKGERNRAHGPKWWASMQHFSGHIMGFNFNEHFKEFKLFYLLFFYKNIIFKEREREKN